MSSGDERIKKLEAQINELEKRLELGKKTQTHRANALTQMIPLLNKADNGPERNESD